MQINTSLCKPFFIRWLLYCLVLVPCSAQVLPTRFDHLLIGERPINDTRVLHQDSAGFLWIGGTEGLFRFDGYQMEAYEYSPDNPEALGDERVLCLLELGNSLWVGTYNGLYHLNQTTDLFTGYTNDPTNSASLSHNTIYSILADNQDQIWVLTETGLDRLLADGRGFEHLGLPVAPEEGQSRRMLISNQTITLGIEGALYRHPTGPGTWQDLPSSRIKGSPMVTHAAIRTLEQDPDGTIWMGGIAGLFRWSETKGLSRVPLGEPVPDIFSCVKDRTGQHWIGTSLGVLRIYPDGRRQKYTYDAKDATSLSTGKVFSILEDRAGLIWFGTRSGLDRYNPTSEYFQNYAPNGTSTSVGCVLEDSHKDLWVGTYGSGVLRIRRSGETQTFRANPQDPTTSLANDNINKLVEVGNQIWIGTEKGLTQMDLESETFKTYLNDPSRNSISNNTITSFCYEPASNSLWIGTLYGLNNLDLERGIFTHYLHNPGNPITPTSNTIWAVFLQKNGTIWFGSPRGLNRKEPDEAKFKSFRHIIGDPQSLSHDRIGPILESADGTLWVGTENGLNKVSDPNGANPRFKHFQEPEGLPAKAIEAMAEDDQGNLWISHNQGITRFDPKLETFDSFGTADGLPTLAFNSGSSGKRKSGQLLFGSGIGFTEFEPEKVFHRRTLSAPVLTRLTINNKVVASGAARFLSEPLTMSHLDQMFSLEFSALEFQEPNKIHYRFKLEGFDPDWVNTEGRRFQSYTNIDPGNYTLKVQAGWGTNNFSELKAIGIKVFPSPWLSWWAYSLYALLILALLWNWSYRQKVTKRQLETKVAERTQDLAARTKELETLDDIVSAINAELHLDAVLDVLLHQGMTLLPVSSPAVALLWEETHQSFKILRRVVAEDLTAPISVAWNRPLSELLTSNKTLMENIYLLEGLLESVPDPVLAIRLEISPNMDLWLGWIAPKSEMLLSLLDCLNRFSHHAFTATTKAHIHQELKRRTDYLMAGIRAAEHIQTAFLPNQNERAKLLGAHFVLYRPKAIVSGDFYWCHQRNDTLFLAVVDCTGHGVQGALSAMMGYVLLNELVREKGMNDPAAVLWALHQGVCTIVNPQQQTSPAAMEITFCAIRRADCTITFAGAGSSLLVAAKQDHEIYQLDRHKTCRHQVGGKFKKSHNPYHNTVLKLEPGDMIYLATDGFSDQHNSKGLKFGSGKMRELLAKIANLELGQQQQALEQALLEHSGHEAQRDDITLIGLRL